MDTPETPDPTTDPSSFYVPPKFRSAIWSIEGGPGTGLNKQGYAGSYQFGTAALKTAGLYTPADGEDVTKNSWKGTITVPGYGSMGVQDFLKNQGAQDTAFNIHMHGLARQAHAMGLDSYIGQTIGGVPITQESLASMMHFAGPDGARRFLTSGGSYNPDDPNKTTVAAYAGRVHNYMTGLPIVQVASNAPPGTDAATTPIGTVVPMPHSPSTASAINPQLAQLQKLALLNRLLTPAQQPAAAPTVGSGPFGWANALRPQVVQQQNPLQTAMTLQALNGNNLLS